jgi:hypothetical protein
MTWHFLKLIPYEKIVSVVAGYSATSDLPTPSLGKYAGFDIVRLETPDRYAQGIRATSVHDSA